LVIDLSAFLQVQDLVAWFYNHVPASRGGLRRSLSSGLAFRWAAIGFAIGFAVIGLVAGRSIGKSTLFQGEPLANPAIEPLPTPTTNQRILLVIGVDRLASDDPRLESVWLVSYFPGQSEITLLPVYPSVLGSPESMRDLAASFSLDRHGEPAPDFLTHLRKKNLWWSGRILVDEIGLIAAIDFLNSPSSVVHQFESALAVGDVPRSWEEPAAALEGQVNLLESACSEAKHPPAPDDLADFLQLVGDHLRADFDILDNYTNWYVASGEGPMQCDFPLKTHLVFGEVP
jgi:hypothetical protein